MAPFLEFYVVGQALDHFVEWVANDPHRKARDRGSIPCEALIFFRIMSLIRRLHLFSWLPFTMHSVGEVYSFLT